MSVYYPYLRAKQYDVIAVEEAAIGEAVTLRTLSGRHVRGTLVEIDPGYSHSFGRPHRSMLAVGPSLKRLLDGTEE